MGFCQRRKSSEPFAGSVFDSLSEEGNACCAKLSALIGEGSEERRLLGNVNVQILLCMEYTQMYRIHLTPCPSLKEPKGGKKIHSSIF